MGKGVYWVQDFTHLEGKEVGGVELSRLLEISPGVTALIGSGGKTTAMYVLAGELACRGTVLCCTTTHIRRPGHMPVLLQPTEEALSAALKARRCVCAGAPAEAGKLTAPAIPMARLAELADFVLVEADGSRGLPLKAHLPHEPVIPSEASQVILLAGASGLGRPVSEAVHRPERFCQLSGLSESDLVTPQALAAVLRQEALAGKVLVNQAEDGGAMAGAKALAALLEARVFAGALRRREWTCLS